MRFTYSGDSVNSLEVLRSLIIQSSPFYHWNYKLVSSLKSQWIAGPYTTISSSPCVIGLISSLIVAIAIYRTYELYTLTYVLTIIGYILSWFVFYGVAVALRCALSALTIVIRLLFSWTRFLPIFSHMTHKYISPSRVNTIVALEDPRTVVWYTTIIIIAFFSLNAQRGSVEHGYLPLLLFVSNLLAVSAYISVGINICFMIVKSYAVG